MDTSITVRESNTISLVVQCNKLYSKRPVDERVVVGRVDPHPGRVRPHQLILCMRAAMKVKELNVQDNFCFPLLLYLTTKIMMISNNYITGGETVIEL